MIMNQRGMDHLLSAKFQIGADASAAAGLVGRDAAAGTDWKMETEILSYARARGVFAGVSLDGAVVHPDQEATKIVYGKLLPPREILTGKVQPPETSRSFLAAVREVEEKAKKRS
jgi:SH3 domain-containing YSC84-like protein 1